MQVQSSRLNHLVLVRLSKNSKLFQEYVVQARTPEPARFKKMVENCNNRYNQNQFNKLPPKEKGQRKIEAYDEAHEIKEMVELYVSPEKIVPRMKIGGLRRTSEIFKNKNVKSLGKEHSGEVGDACLSICSLLEINVLTFLKKNEEFAELKKIFEGMPVIDIGPGPYRAGYDFCKILNAKGYIGVEPYYFEQLEENFINPKKGDSEFGRNNTLGWESAKKIPFSLIPEDALTFLKRLPDHSVGVITAGTDKYVLFGDEKSLQRIEKIHDYIATVNKEIARVLHPKSALLSVAMSVFGHCEQLELTRTSNEGKYAYEVFGLKKEVNE